MRLTGMLLGVFAAVLAGPALSAQAPPSDMDTHIAAAKAAAGLDYRSRMRLGGIRRADRRPSSIAFSRTPASG